MSVAVTDAAPGLFSAELLARLRGRFEFADRDLDGRRRVYFENAGGSLSLRRALEAAAEVAALPDNTGRHTAASAYLGRILAQGLADAAAFLNARAGVVFGGESTTAHLFRIVEAVTAARKGTNVVCTNLDHAALYDATHYGAEQHGLEWRVAPLDPNTASVSAEAVASRVDRGTVLVGLTHASNIIGARTDVAAVVAGIRRHNPHTAILVDGAQHAPHALIDVDALGVDAYVFAAYKAFAPPGVTFAYLSPQLAEMPHPRLFGKPADHWELGTRNAGGYAAWSAVVDYLCWLGGQFLPAPTDRRRGVEAALRAIEAHEAALTDRLLHGTAACPGLLRLPRIRLHGSPRSGRDRDAVFAFSVAGFPARDFVARCAASGIAVHDRQADAYSRHTLAALGLTECVRVSLAHYNTPDEIDAFLEQSAAILGEDC